MMWFEHTDEEREDWRQLSMTKAFLGALRDLDSEFGTAALQEVMAGRYHDAAFGTGKQDGIVSAIHLLEYKAEP